MNKNNIKGIAAVVSGIGAFICSLISASDFLDTEKSTETASVKKRGDGYSAVFISGSKDSRKWIFSAAAAFLLAITGTLYTVMYYEGRKNRTERD
ncbi:MAG: hypothetical protein ACI4XF_10215 [Oscillospiraceae bacterium]